MRTSRRESSPDERASRAHAVGRSGNPRRWALPLAVLLVGALVMATHWPVLHARALSLDDAAFVTRNPLVTTPGWPSVRRFFVEVLRPSTVKGYYLPISMTSLMADYAMGGRPEDLYVFHRTSLALHVLNAVLILILLYRLFGAIVPAGIAALLFGLHPLTVEPVAWVGERKTLLAMLFALGCLLCYVEHARRKRRAWLAASLALYLLALLSKPTVTMLPVLLMLLDYWPLGRFGLRAVYSKWPFLALSLISAIITLVSHQRTAGLTAPDYARWPLHAGYLLAFYLQKIVWPRDLSCAYPQPVPFALGNPAVLLSGVGVALLTLLLVVSRRRAPGPFTGWAFFVIAIAPTLGLVQYSWVIASDKYVYFPAIGLLMLLAAGTAALLESPRVAGRASRAVILLLVALVLAAEARGVRSTLRNWADSLTLYRHMEQVAPDSYAVQAQLGVLLEKAAAHEEAIAHLRRAIALVPEYGEAHYNLGVALAGQGRLAESIEHLRKADQLLPDDPATIYNLGMALRLAGRLDEAAEQFARAVRLNPRDVRSLDELSGALVMQGRTDEAIDRFRAALAIAPDDASLHFRISMALLMRGSGAEAVGHLREAIRLSPDWPQPLNALAWLLATSPDPSVRDGEEALRLASRAVELTASRDPQVLDTQAAAQAASGRFAEAVATERDAIQLASRSPTDTLAPAMRERLKLYQRGLGYTESAPVGVPPRR